jgi:nucleoside-diphosphate-sugar epimerase
LLENALDLYLNSKNELPFSVYSKVVPKNEICERYLEIENLIVQSKKQYVILRISEMYGISEPASLIEQLLTLKEGEFENSQHDFIYDGDVINAIEISLRKEVMGLFDIASGQSIELRKIVDLIKKIGRITDDFNIRWKRKKQDIAFNCNNFKFYKWEPLVPIDMGLKALLSLKRRDHVELQCTFNS